MAVRLIRETSDMPDHPGLTQEMEAWLDDGSHPYPSLRRGAVVEGVVVRVDRDGVWVDVGAKSEGLVPNNEMHSLGIDPLDQLQLGASVYVYVLQTEGQEGELILSVDRARGEQGWRTLQQHFDSNEGFEAEVVDYNRGGVVVNYEGVRGFIPGSQLAAGRPTEGQGLADLRGQRLHLKVLEINRRRNRLILSERLALQEWRTQQRERLLAELREGEIRRGRVTSIRTFGAFVDLGGADGLVHLSEVSWERGQAPRDVVKVGDEVDVYVLKVDPESKRIALSLRRANPQAWEHLIESYQVGQVVQGAITKVVSFGAFVRIDDTIEGLIHLSELSDRRIAHPNEVVSEGDVVSVKIIRIEPERYRLGLSLRQVQEQAQQEQAQEEEVEGTST